MPQMGVSVSEGTITKWLKQPGEAIAQDEALLEISTDKVDTEVPSPGEGIVAEILVAEGETVEVGTVLAVDRARRLRRRGARRRSACPRRCRPARRACRRVPGRCGRTRGASRRHVAQCHRVRRPRRPSLPASGNGRTFVSPVVARIAAEHGVDPRRRAGHRHRRSGDEEGHPRVHRVRRPARPRLWLRLRSLRPPCPPLLPQRPRRQRSRPPPLPPRAPRSSRARSRSR